MSQEKEGVMQMLTSVHDILSASQHIIHKLDAGELVEAETMKALLETHNVALSALLEHHLKIIDMLDDLIAKIPAQEE